MNPAICLILTALDFTDVEAYIVQGDDHFIQVAKKIQARARLVKIFFGHCLTPVVLFPTVCLLKSNLGLPT